MSLKDKFNNAVTAVSNKVNSVAQGETARENIPKIITEGMPGLVRAAAAEGAVLVENNGILPFKKGTKLSLFGRNSYDYFFVGYGSGGDVNRPYEVSLEEGVKRCDSLELNEELSEFYEKWRNEHPINHGYWGHWPLRYTDINFAEYEDEVKKAAENSDAAVVTIGRSAGEDRDNQLTDESYYLHGEEIAMLETVSRYFDNIVILLNVGGIMDMGTIKSFEKIGAVMYVWQGGMESGNSVADLLSGKVSPSGRLSDTVALVYGDYPSSECFGAKDYNEYREDIYVGYRYFETFAGDRVLYPFGYGLSYSSFEIKHIKTSASDDGFETEVSVKNTGSCNAKEVVQLYIEKPDGNLGNPSRELAAFAKTKELEPGEEQKLTLFVSPYQLTSYDDCGATGFRFAYVTQKGDYNFYVGKNVRDAEKVFTFYQAETELFAQHKQAAAPQHSFEIMCAVNENGEKALKTKTVSLQKYDLGSRILNNLPEGTEITGDKGIKLTDVKEERATLDEFVAQLSPDELEAISRGDYNMDSPLGAKGNAGAIGGVLASLREKGVPAAITTDGPSGIRLQASCSLIPIGTLLACTFNTELVTGLYSAIAKEMKNRGSDILLGPGVNIHRSPLCGRNFEYFSEDPYLTGMMAAASVEGIQSEGGSACPKHYACNNQEYKRTVCDSRLSERALREIYLKGFEICVERAKPKNIMTSYNKINGVWGHYNYDLCTTILRGEWGFGGSVMTDWWMRSSKSPEFPNLCDQAYRVRAQVDVFMPGGKRVNNGKPDGTLLKTYGKKDGITLGELQRTAKNVLKMVLDTKL
ncbi:MAG: glycoside hydrolase family 3 C-terminal domain-containing protein [Eubacterium sp.]|nr:glycoside hydrolase family 3 C-terminal domain-containing protein [Eubacterium sp.]